MTLTKLLQGCHGAASRGSPALCYQTDGPQASHVQLGRDRQGQSGRPGKKSFSSVNSTQEDRAARLYSKLWLSRKESSERLRGLLMAVTRYSE